MNTYMLNEAEHLEEEIDRCRRHILRILHWGRETLIEGTDAYTACCDLLDWLTLEQRFLEAQLGKRLAGKEATLQDQQEAINARTIGGNAYRLLPAIDGTFARMQLGEQYEDLDTISVQISRD